MRYLVEADWNFGYQVVIAVTNGTGTHQPASHQHRQAGHASQDATLHQPYDISLRLPPPGHAAAQCARQEYLPQQ